MPKKELHQQRYIATHAEKLWPTIRAMVSPPEGSNDKPGKNRKTIAYDLHLAGYLRRREADAVVTRLIADRMLRPVKYGASWWVYERPAEPVRFFGPKRIRGGVLDSEGVARLRYSSTV